MFSGRRTILLRTVVSFSLFSKLGKENVLSARPRHLIVLNLQVNLTQLSLTARLVNLQVSLVLHNQFTVYNTIVAFCMLLGWWAATGSGQ
jgi:hypothetical protein